MKTLVLFPGLAADDRLFSALKPGSHPVFTVQYLIPFKSESLEAYAQRIADTLPRDSTLVYAGVSFGGVLAQAVARIRPAEKIILISSISAHSQLPSGHNILKYVPLHNWLPAHMVKSIVLWAGKKFTTKSETEQTLFESMVHDADIRLIRWGIEQVLHWKQAIPPAGIIHIHGRKDRLFPIRRIPVTYAVDGGQHFMIIQQPGIISRLLQELTG